MNAVLAALLALQNAPGVKFAEPLRIEPARPACVLARAFPVLRARIEPWSTVRAARLFFRPEAYPLWYSTAMQRTNDGFVAVLPKPRPSARRILYFVEAEGLRERARSLEQGVVVVEEAAQCPGEVAEAVESAAVTVAVPSGAPPVPPVPPGFGPVGAVGEQRGGGGRRDALITGGALAAAVGAAAVLSRAPARPETPPGITPELTVLDSAPPPGSRLSLAEGAVLSMRVLVRMHRAVHAGQVMAVLYRSVEGAARPCGTLTAAHEGFLQGAVREVAVGGPLQRARPCEPSDRVRIIVTELGQEVVGTGIPGLPDLLLQYFVSP